MRGLRRRTREDRGTGLAEAKQAAAAIVRETLDEIGHVGWPKTSGNRGVQGHEPGQVLLSGGGRAPQLVTTAWWKEERGERVFVDYNQNAGDRTILSAYSVRGHPDATVSAPVRSDAGRARRGHAE